MEVENCLEYQLLVHDVASKEVGYFVVFVNGGPLYSCFRQSYVVKGQVEDEM